MKKLTFALIVFFLSSCQLFEPKPESEKFYCKVNGKAWRPEKASYSLRTPLTAEWFKNGNFGIAARNENETIVIGIKLGINNPLEIKQYELQSQTSGSTGDYYYDTSNPPREKLTSKSGSVWITKFDNSSVSGTFEFTTHSDIKNKDYKITKGQFNNLLYTKY
jgi:hypothetical protein